MFSLNVQKLVFSSKYQPLWYNLKRINYDEDSTFLPENHTANASVQPQQLLHEHHGSQKMTLDVGQFSGRVLSVRRYVPFAESEHNASSSISRKWNIESFIDFENVVMEKGKLTLYAAQAWERRIVQQTLKGTLPRYEKVVGCCSVYKLPDVPIQVPEGLFLRSNCRTYLNETAIFLTLWFIDNQYHLINDNIVPILTNLHSNPSCSTHPEEGFVCSPPVTLYTMEDDDRRNKAAIAASSMFLDLIVPRRKEAATILQGGPHCLHRMTWGRGRRAFAMPVEGSLLASLHILRQKLKLAGLQQQANVDNFAILISRTKNKGFRWLKDESMVLSTCKSLDLQCSSCCSSWDRKSLQQLLLTVSTCTYVVGAHGAGLSLVLFAKQGARLIDFVDGGSRVYKELFPRMMVSTSGYTVLASVGASLSQGLHVERNLTSSVFECAKSLPVQDHRYCHHPRITVKSHQEVIMEDSGKKVLVTSVSQN